jgi:cytochrome c-type biogenesis protein CcmH/NrfG
MNLKLQQAINATREGQSKEAQVLLTQVLTEDPEEVQAWFLLSLLVDSEQKQIAYLRKVLELDPQHEKAAHRLAQLEAVAEPETGAEPELQPLPTWVTEADGESGLEATLFTHDFLEERERAQEEPSTLPAAAPSMAEIDSRREQRAQLTRILVVLIAAAIVVLVLLLYLVFTTF